MLRVDPLLHRVSKFVTGAIAASIAGGSSDEQADVARLACLVGADALQAPIRRSILRLLELQLGVEVGETLPERFRRLHLLVIASVLAGTPDVPVG